MIRSSFFSTEEKEIIKLIAEKCAQEPICVLDFLKDYFFVENALLYNPKKREISLAIPIENKNSKKEIARFWDLFVLFKYLDDNAFTVSVPFDGNKESNLKCIWIKAPSPNYKIVDNNIIIGEKYTWSDGKIFDNGKPIMQCYEIPKRFYDNFELLFKYTHATKRLIELIGRDFKSFDELALEELKQQTQKLDNLAKEIKKQTNELKTQSEEAKNQSNELKAQSEEAKNQSNELKAQSEEAKNQSNELKAQSEEAKNQSNELKTQSEEAKNQSNELKTQSEEAKKQTFEASEQSKQAKRQTKYSIYVVILTLLTGIISCLISYQAGKNDLKRDDPQKPISVIDSSLNIFVKDSINLKLNDIRLHQNDSVSIKLPSQLKETEKKSKIPSKPTSRTTKKRKTES